MLASALARLLWSSGFLAACALAQQEVVPPRFGRDIRPLLADRCFACHGPDASSRQADLRLDERESAVARRPDGRAAIVPGNAEQSLLWQRICASAESERMPPPQSGKNALAPAERQLLRQWIDSGAEYEPHWAFMPPKAPPLPPGAESTNPIDRFLLASLARAGQAAAPPATKATLARRLFLVLTGLPPTTSELDAFLADADPAAYEQLVDRLLTAEPYRSRHAEHLAGIWLDAARYADTSGIHMDAGRQIWPWRDWLLQALRDDLPYARFVRDQLAGDLLPTADASTRTATGFLRCHVTTDEGGAIDEEYLVEYAAERTNTVGTVFLGLTIGCARCHDHKYDPITQRDYYRLFGFFNQNDEPGLYSQVADAERALEPFLLVPGPADEARSEQLRNALAVAEAALQQESATELAERERFFAELAATAETIWRTTDLAAATSRGGAVLSPLADGSVLASGPNPNQDVWTLDYRVAGGNLQALLLEILPHPSMPGGKAGRSPNGNAVLRHLRLAARPAGSQDEFVTVPLQWAKADYEQPDGDYRLTNALHDDARGFAIGAHLRDATPVRAIFLATTAFGAPAGTELRLELHCDSVYAQHVFGCIRVRAGALPANLSANLSARLPLARSALRSAGPFLAADSGLLYATAFGPEQSEQLRDGAQWGKLGWQYDRRLREDSVVQSLPGGQNATYLGQELYAPTPRQLSLALGSDDGFQVYCNGELVAERKVDRAAAKDQDRVELQLPAGKSMLVLKIVNTGGIGGYYLRYDEVGEVLLGPLWQALLPADVQDTALRQQLATAFRQHHSPDYRARLQQKDNAAAALRQHEAQLPRTMVMQERSMPRPTYLLQRGEYDKPLREEPLQADIPALFGGLPPDSSRNRLALADWLVARDNPLTWRVRVNRLWEFVFGYGLVRTGEDFGLQGEWPDHQDLLDWLAVWYRDQGQSTRELLRLLVLSQAFQRQAEPAPALRELDPENRLLGRFPRRRLPAEAIRDQALYLSGLLREQFGGKSVKPPQPPGLWEEVAMPQSNTRNYRAGGEEEAFRRSLYTYWKRACPPPFLLVFDAPTREYCSVRRSSTNTPLQALALWNEPGLLAAAQELAAQNLHAGGNDEARILRLYRSCTGQELAAGLLPAALASLRQWQQRYRSDAAAAQDLLNAGGRRQQAGLASSELAAESLLAASFLNLDATLCID